jgi:serine/threonine protein kinase
MDTSLRFLLVFIILLPVLTVWISTLVWVYRDAERCGKPGILVALLVGLLFWPVGLLVWLILRQDYLAQALPGTAVPPLLPPGNCPQCGRAMVPGSTQGLCPACLLRQAAFESVAPGPGMAGFTPPAPEELAKLFPQFESLEWLGKGGMGAVYKAKQTSLDRFVALKILPAEAAEDPAFGERFQREARALAQLSHPNIVGVHDFGQAGAYAYLVMEFVDGANLRQLQRGGHLSPREALAIVPQICEALQFAHDRGIVHRDIKPENILIDTQGRVKIADFGLAKLMRPDAGAPDLTLTRHAVGTPQYMAPEQIEKPETVDHRADIYSLGVVFYEMLTGELPIGRFPSPSQRVEVDVRLDEVVLKALEKEPALRYQQASAFKTRVETVAGGTPAESASGTDDPTPATPTAYQQPAAHAGIAAPAPAPSQAHGANQMPSAPPTSQKRSGCWLLLAVLLVVPVLVGIALAAVVFWVTPHSPKPLKDPVPLELQLEMRNSAGGSATMPLNPMPRAWNSRFPADHRQFVTSIGVNTQQQYRVDGTIKPLAYHDQYVIDLTVRRKSSAGFSRDVGGQENSENESIIFRDIIGITKGDSSMRQKLGDLDGYEFFVTLTRVDEAAASGAKAPVQDRWFWPLLVMVFGALILFGWAQKRPGPRMAGLGTGFLGGGALLGLIFLAQTVWAFQRNSQDIMALDAGSIASGIASALRTAFAAMLLFVLGAIFAGLALFKYRYRALWFHRVLVAAGILMLFLFPIGTVLGVLLLVYVGNRRGEFGAMADGDFPAPSPDQAQAANEPAISPDQPKLCPTAIWGAVQAAICLTLIPACFQLQGNERTTAILALVAVGCSTAICGAIAISQIRRSEGKLYGMGLAVFDLVVPVAIAAASVVFLFYSSSRPNLTVHCDFLNLTPCITSSDPTAGNTARPRLSNCSAGWRRGG